MADRQGPPAERAKKGWRAGLLGQNLPGPLMQIIAQPAVGHDLDVTHKSHGEAANADIARHVGLEAPVAVVHAVQASGRTRIFLVEEIGGKHAKNQYDVMPYFSTEIKHVGVWVVMIGLMSPLEVIGDDDVPHARHLEGLVAMGGDLVALHVGVVVRQGIRLHQPVLHRAAVGRHIIEQQRRPLMFDGIAEALHVVGHPVVERLSGKDADVVEAFELGAYRLGERGALSAAGQTIEIDGLGLGETDIVHQVADKLRVGGDIVAVASMKDGESVVAQQLEIIEHGAARTVEEPHEFVQGGAGRTGQATDDAQQIGWGLQAHGCWGLNSGNGSRGSSLSNRNERRW